MTTINSGSGNAGTPRSMNRKGGSERKQAKRRWEYAQHHDVGRTGKPHAPVPVAIFSSYSSTFETEQKKAERERKALAEEEQYLIGGAMA